MHRHIIELGKWVSYVYLNDLNIGVLGVIDELKANPSIKGRLMDIGFVPGARIVPVMKNVGGNMVAYQVKGTIVALRKDDTSEIRVHVI